MNQYLTQYLRLQKIAMMPLVNTMPGAAKTAMPGTPSAKPSGGTGQALPKAKSDPVNTLESAGDKQQCQTLQSA